MSPALEHLEPTERSYIVNGGALNNNFTPKDSGTELTGGTNYGGSEESIVELFNSNEAQKEGKKTSVCFTSATVINTMVGAGILGMPYALHEAGFVVGLILLVVVALVTDQSLVLQIAAGRAVGATTYQECVESLFGKTGFVLCAILQFMFPFIGLVSYNIIVGDTLTKIILQYSSLTAGSLWARREMVTAMATIIVTLPLCLFRNIARLSNVSAVSTCTVAIIGLLIIARAPDMTAMAQASAQPITLYNTGIGPAIGIMSFAFVCHQTTYLIYHSLENNTQKRWNTTIHISVTMSFLLCLVVAIAAYIPFTNTVQGDIFENFCWDDHVMNAGRLMFAFTVLCTFPLECFACRQVLETSFFRSRQPQPLSRHILLTLSLVLMALIISFSTDCLAIVLQLNGIVAGCPLAFIIPSLTFIKSSDGPVLRRVNFTAIMVLIFGIFALVTGIVTMIVNYASIAECSHGVEMDYCHAETNQTQIATSHMSLKHLLP